MATVPGIDVSYWNAGIDWPKVRAAGQRFVFVKATEGDTYSDPTFDDNWLGAKSAGLLRGAYCFFRPKTDPQKQAERFIKYVKAMNDDGELPPALDLETSDGQPKEKIIARAKVWLDEVEQAFGRKPIIYSGTYFLQAYFSVTGGGPPEWAKEYPLWLAQYPYPYTPGMSPALPNGWFKWTFWQYSETGKVNGINARVDLDLFNGTLEEFYQFAGVQMLNQPGTYTVKSGDTLQSVANRFGLTIRELVVANPQLIKPGVTLNIPAPAAIPNTGESEPPVQPRVYKVQPGDTLTFIAIKFGTTVAAIAAANNLTNINAIQVGQELIIPS
jgi:lysozyme